MSEFDLQIIDNQIVAGIMSGTSLDGLDIALCRFRTGAVLSYDILHAETIPYDDVWKKSLSEAFNLSGSALMELHAAYGKFIGTTIEIVKQKTSIVPDLIASHGHTVFHRPDLGFTFQLGSGASIAAFSGTDTVCDFRTTDVALNGQGAPLVPIGDHLLFGGHRFCLNLGGIANITNHESAKTIAFDVCPANMALNLLAAEAGFSFDEGGTLASEGTTNQQLLQQLNGLPFYKIRGAKSLGREWFEESFLPLISIKNSSVKDRLRTVCEHIATKIADALPVVPGTTMLTTGGGAFNDFLINLIDDKVSAKGIHTIVPESSVVQFKEAIIFALLGWLRFNEQINTLSSVTGAKLNSSSGCIYLSPNRKK